MWVYVHLGPVAIRIGRYWIGVASGNVFCTTRRRTPERAIEDARKFEHSKSQHFVART